MKHHGLVFSVAGLVLVLSSGLASAQHRSILYNTNSFPVWVATGTAGYQQESSTADYGPFEMRSKGWFKIAARDNIAIDEYFGYLHVKAYLVHSKQWVGLQPHEPAKHKPVDMFQKADNFNERFLKVGTWLETVKQKGGELRPYYPAQAFWNKQANRYELKGWQNLQAGEPPQALPPAVRVATFTNRSGARVYFKVVSGDGRTLLDTNLANGAATSVPLQATNPPAYIVITQDNGALLSFSLPQATRYEFHRNSAGKIENRFGQ